MKKVMKKVIVILVIVIVIGAELILLANHEQEHQNTLAGEIYDAIDFNLDMIKIAIQTNDVEIFEKNIDEAKEKITEIDKLFFIKEDDKNYVRRINEHLEFLESKKEFLNEVEKLKNNVLKINEKLKESYGEQGKIQKETFGGIAEEINKIKLNTEEYNFEATKQIAIATNEMLDKITTKTNELAKCVGACYKDQIAKINEALINDIKDFNTKVNELNLNIEKEFSFKTIDKIKSERPRSL